MGQQARFLRLAQGSVTQLVEFRAFNSGVVGSSPTGPTKEQYDRHCELLPGFRIDSWKLIEDVKEEPVTEQNYTQKVVEYALSRNGAHTYMKRLADSEFFYSGLSEERQKRIVNNLLQDLLDDEQACTDGVERARAALGVEPEVKERTVRIVLDVTVSNPIHPDETSAEEDGGLVYAAVDALRGMAPRVDGHNVVTKVQLFDYVANGQAQREYGKIPDLGTFQ